MQLLRRYICYSLHLEWYGEDLKGYSSICSCSSKLYPRSILATRDSDGQEVSFTRFLEVKFMDHMTGCSCMVFFEVKQVETCGHNTVTRLLDTFPTYVDVSTMNLSCLWLPNMPSDVNNEIIGNLLNDLVLKQSRVLKDFFPAEFKIRLSALISKAIVNDDTKLLRLFKKHKAEFLQCDVAKTVFESMNKNPSMIKLRKVFRWILMFKQKVVMQDVYGDVLEHRKFSYITNLHKISKCLPRDEIINNMIDVEYALRDSVNFVNILLCCGWVPNSDCVEKILKLKDAYLIKLLIKNGAELSVKQAIRANATLRVSKIPSDDPSYDYITPILVRSELSEESADDEA